jgi:hypothetical protein
MTDRHAETKSVSMDGLRRALRLAHTVGSWDSVKMVIDAMDGVVVGDDTECKSKNPESVGCGEDLDDGSVESDGTAPRGPKYVTARSCYSHWLNEREREITCVVSIEDARSILLARGEGESVKILIDETW